MSFSKIQNTYQDFSYRFLLAQELPKDKYGIILVGNTRAGKSTLACGMAGAQMKIVYQQGKQVFINPVTSPFQKCVANTSTSVTEQPNFFPKSKINKYPIIDMPGNADNSRLREVINFHYISKMASNLQKIRIFIVITLEIQNEKLVISDKQIKMMEYYKDLFPSYSNYISFIINKIPKQYYHQKNVKTFIRNQVIGKSKNQKFKNYYMNVTDNKIFVFAKPQYKIGPKGEQQHSEPMTNFTDTLVKIANKSQENDFTSLNIQQLKIKYQKQNDNQQFQAVLESFCQKISKDVKQCWNIWQNSIILTVQSILSSKASATNISMQINDFIQKHQTKTLHKRVIPLVSKMQKLILPQSKIIDFVYSIANNTYNSNNISLQTIFERTIFLFSSYHKHKGLDQHIGLNQQIMALYVFIQRRMEQLSFIHSLFSQTSKSKRFQKIDTIKKDQVVQKQLAQNFGKLGSQKLITIQSKIIDIDIPAVFMKYANNQQALYLELCKILKNIKENIKSKQNLKPDQKTKKQNAIKETIQQIQLYYFTQISPSTQQEIKNVYTKLLDMYDHFSDTSKKFKIVIKIAKLLQKKKSYKDAIVLNLYLTLSEQVMKLLDQNILKTAQTSKQKRQQGLQWLQAISKQFQKLSKVNYAERCLQKAKGLVGSNFDLFLQLEQTLSNLSDQIYLTKMTNLKRSRQSVLKSEKAKILNWDQIQKQIKYLQLKNKGQINNSNVLLFKYRKN